MKSPQQKAIDALATKFADRYMPRLRGRAKRLAVAAMVDSIVADQKGMKSFLTRWRKILNEVADQQLGKYAASKPIQRGGE